MDFWMTLWKIVLIVGMVLFAAMALWGTVFGFRDIKKFLRSLTQPIDTEEEADI